MAACAAPVQGATTDFICTHARQVWEPSVHHHGEYLTWATWAPQHRGSKPQLEVGSLAPHIDSGLPAIRLPLGRLSSGRGHWIEVGDRNRGVVAAWADASEHALIPQARDAVSRSTSTQASKGKVRGPPWPLPPSPAAEIPSAPSSCSGIGPLRLCSSPDAVSSAPLPRLAVGAKSHG